MALSLSERILAITPSVTLTIDARAKEMAARGEDVIGFGAGEPDFDTPEMIRDAAKRALDKGLTRYTPVPGTMALREAIAGKLLRDNGLTDAPSEIIVSGGAKHSLYNALCALVNPGDEVLIPAPYWVSYPEMVRMAGGVPVFVMGREEDGFQISAELLRPHVTARTKCLILNSPGNPCGAVCSRETLRGIAELALEKAFYVLSDEIYEKLIYDGLEHVSIASLGEEIRAQTLVVSGVSKTYAMTGWRIGYVAAPKPIVQAMTSFQSHATSNPNSIAQYAAAEAYGNCEQSVRAMVREFDQRRTFMHALVTAIPGLSARKPQGAFYMMVGIRGLLGKAHHGRVIGGSMDFADLLLTNKNVAVVPGLAFGADEYVRVSYAVSKDKIERGFARIAAFVSELEG